MGIGNFCEETRGCKHTFQWWLKKINLYNPQWFVIMVLNSSANVVSSQSSMLFYGFFNTFTVLSSNTLLQSKILTSDTELCKENYVSLKSVL